MQTDTVLIFGGTGFVGTHLADYLLRERPDCEVVLADQQDPGRRWLPRVLREEMSGKRVTSVQCDVRQNIQAQLPSWIKPDLVVNLAAVHREPGHEPHEYFETNINGARNVCAFASEMNCRRIMFTSSIAVYGPSEKPRSEESLPVPVTPYGASKLAAEEIHRGWVKAEPPRRLLIARPGVIFGPGEGGNVTRLVRAVNKKKFVYLGNKETVKAGGYVREFCRTLEWGMNRLERNDQQELLYNFTMCPPPTIEDYVRSISEAGEVKEPSLSLPCSPIYLGSLMLHKVSKLIGFSSPLHPVRVRKVIHSNYILSDVLSQPDYSFEFSLKGARKDWKNSLPGDWE